jgi:7,8-dihydropterin-6-yl-methyl-4-(beta-D-ribofuranosyl)aminobenzene 5'-phosphate synthase
LSGDLVRLTCLVDNSVSHSSTLWAEHGLSFLVETPAGNLLWDTGQSGTVLLHNLQALNRPDLLLHAVALSHAHDDHVGGLEALLSLYPNVDIYAHPEILSPRYGRRGQDLREIGLSPALRERAAVEWRLDTAPQQIVPGVYTTGSIAPRPYPRGASPRHMVRRDGALQVDDYADDISLVLRVRGGIVLLCGCCHAGLRNTLATVRARYDEPLKAVIGGTHLVQADDGELQALVAALQMEGSPPLYLNHCTGERAVDALRRALGDGVHTCPTGTVIEFSPNT